MNLFKREEKKPYTYVFPQKKASFAYSSIEMRKSSGKSILWIIGFFLIIAIVTFFGMLFDE